MYHEHETEVLVVGAGPVGMLTALELAEQGAQVDVIDKEGGVVTHSCACALHPRTLRLLARLDLAEEVMSLGRRVDIVAFYEGESRRAELKFSEIQDEFPFLVILPQSNLEELLEQRLLRHRGTKLHWEHRLDNLLSKGDHVLATVDKLCQTAKGYPVATWQQVVDKTLRWRAAFVVGADGRDSHVRPFLHVEHERAGEPECFAVYEFESDGEFADEVRVVFHEGTANVLWPLPGNRSRWTFQIVPADLGEEAHLKDRFPFHLVDPLADQEALRHMERFIERRALWFGAPVEELDWFTTIAFGGRLATQFGRGRCWLAGDAAHLTSPIGMQSMNLGLSEAAELAQLLVPILRHEAPLDGLEAYNQTRRNEWRRLLGLERRISPSDGALAWARQHGDRMLSCVPASGQDLANLLHQVGLDFPADVPSLSSETDRVPALGSGR